MLSIYALRRGPDGRSSFPSFLIDRWCVGLKETYVQIDMDSYEFRDSVLKPISDVVELERLDNDRVRRFVHAAVRFTRDNGFHLPEHYQRWVALLGALPDADGVEPPDFGMDGGLFYVGTREDLKRRLPDGDVDAFLARDDVDADFQDGDFTLRDDASEAMDSALSTLRDAGLGAVRQWCFASDEAPHPRLADAWEIMIESILQIGADPEEGADDADGAELRRSIKHLASLEGRNASRDLSDAMGQIERFMQQFKDPSELFRVLKLEPDESDA